jgi:Ca2+-transporting ATPase
MTTVHCCEVTSKGAGTSVAVAQPAFPHISIAAPYVAFTKGAMDRLVDVTASVWFGDHAEALDEPRRKELAEVHDRLAQQGMRVLATAFRPLERPPEKGREASAERELILLGMFGIIDPPRPEAKHAVETCRSAGIRPVMITGDHPLTAREIAKQVGIGSEADPMTGAELDRLEGEELEERVSQTSVFARVSPAHKLRIVEALQKRGHVVAMTGDGVNDAPALKKADIGVSMGITGTDVAKEAADMVLRDDNFATIVAAVEEGRVIFDNIRKFVKYLLAANSGEIWVMLAGPLLGMPLPLLPLQILWMNLITDGPPALALGVEPADRSTMQRPPYPAGQSILAGGVGRGIVWIGLLMGLGSLAVGYFYWQAGRETWQTMTFTTLTLSQMALALAVRSERESLFRIGLLSNKTLLAAIMLSVLLQIAAVYTPFLRAYLGTKPLAGSDLALAVAVSTTVFWALEIEKAWKRRSR